MDNIPIIVPENIKDSKETVNRSTTAPEKNVV